MTVRSPDDAGSLLASAFTRASGSTKHAHATPAVLVWVRATDRSRPATQQVPCRAVPCRAVPRSAVRARCDCQGEC
jgi:hypothetical protein